MWPHRWQPTRLPCPWDSPGKNTGVACHFLLQCMKVKSESEVAQLCPTLSNPMDCSLPGSSLHGIFQARALEWGAIAFSFPCGLAGKECSCNAGDLGSIPELGRSPGEGKGYPLQYSGLENSMDCIVHEVAKSQTRLRNFHFQIGHSFSSKEQVSLISCLQSSSAVILEPPKIKYLTVSIVSPSLCHEMMGPDAMILYYTQPNNVAF